jgi:hypothetical protein
MPNTFLEKTIESWLTRTNELGYTLPYAQVLVSRGHAVIHVSKQNAFEQGKDLISIGADKRVYAYQLKGGNITDHRWTTEVWPEIEKLRGLPVVHPSIARGTRHTSLLVTNGTIEDTVRRMITDLNNTTWKKAPLKTVVRGELLRDFLDASASFVPKELADYRAFLDLFFSDGRAFVDDEKLSALLEDVLDLGNRAASSEARKRNIAAAILSASYAITNAAAEKNHIACIYALARVTGYVFALIERYRMPKKYWRDSLRLLLDTIDAHGQELESEMLAGGYDNLCRDIWDGSVALFRRHAAFDVLTAHKLSQLLRHDERWASLDLQKLLAWNQKGQILWGEAAAYSMVLRFWLLHATLPAEERLFDLVAGPLAAIVEANAPDLGNDAFFSPYYGIETAVQFATGTLTAPIGESFRGHSYSSGSLVDLLARYNRRHTLEQLWRQVSRVAHVEYQPAAKWECFRRRGQSGRELGDLPKQRKSWAELQHEAAIVDEAVIPKALLAHPEFLPFFMLAYPHHVTRNLVRHFDTLVSHASSAPMIAGAPSAPTLPKKDVTPPRSSRARQVRQSGRGGKL